ncbi:PHP domain-containing protein [Umezawaea beigongshangensis]|uniref:PHP domain-containing protein n=1 Tax=Umezawaea beigongshangensis TaxID=2780383 RepID=UPI0018F1975B|nr:PHP domain-containing protein [Umezawaea beigongshangensis]
MTIDLHTHSTASDGTVPPSELPLLAARAGLEVVALTDHDTLSGVPDAARAAAAAGVELVAGVEVSCLLDTTEVHLLGYFVDPGHRPLAQELERIGQDRSRRAELMVGRCRDLGADITPERVRAVAGSAPVGRPHVAAALVESGAVRDTAEAFTAAWIGDGGRADVPKHVLTTRHAVELITAAGGAAVLAHPRSSRRRAEVTDAQLADLAAAGLAGIETDHPEHEPEVRSALRALAAELGLLRTGSSDFHGERKDVRLGEFTTAREVLEALRARSAAR